MNVTSVKNLNSLICKTMTPRWTIVFITLACLSLISCLEPEGEWGEAPGTGPGTGPGSGLNLAERLRVIHAEAVSGSLHTIVLTGSGSIGVQNLTFADKSGITITIMGDGKESTVSLSDDGTLFTIGSGVTLVLDNGVTLRGRSNNNAPLVVVNSGGLLEMRAGAKIVGNTAGYNRVGGVNVNKGGGFIMVGGEISGNSGGSVGGVYVADGAEFQMADGKISGNTSTSNYGGGVRADGLFTMINGEISHNKASYGGGVSVNGGNFTMYAGNIHGNTATTTSSYYGGGGVYLYNAAFTMNGGVISFNTASTGGGVFVDNYYTHFIKNGGIIYGYAITDSNRNTATAGVGSNNKGHAVFVDSSPNKRRETTAGVEVDLDSDKIGAAGGWE